MTRNKSAGVALITALLVVSIATVAAVTLAAHQALDVRRTANLIDADQAWLYSKGGEAWAKSILIRDQQDNKTDSLDQPWATTLPPIELPGGFIVGYIEDLQARLNLNNLVDADKANPETLSRFQRLLNTLELDEALAQAVADWLDKDINAIPPDGAEDDYYLGLDTPYLAANRPMVSVSELRLVKGFDQETYDKVTPFVTALPAHTAINVNTAPPEVLASLSPKLTLEIAERLVEQRENEPFEDIEAFTNDPLIKELELPAEEIENLSTSSEYFLLHSETRIGQGRVATESLFYRGQKANIRVVQRNQAELL